MKKLPVLDSVAEVFWVVSRRYFKLLSAGNVGIALSVLGYFLLSGVVTYFVPAHFAQGWTSIFRGPNLTTFFALAAIFILIFGMVSTATSWHRFILIGANEESEQSRFRFELGYILTLIKITILVLVLVVPVMYFISYLGMVALVLGRDDHDSGKIFAYMAVGVGIVGYVTIFYISLRVSLALPLAAISGRGGLVEVFDKSSGNGGRLLVYAFLIEAVVMLASYVFGYIDDILRDMFDVHRFTVADYALLLLWVPAFLYIQMINIVMLSVAYREIIGLPPAPEAGTEPA